MEFEIMINQKSNSTAYGWWLISNGVKYKMRREASCCWVLNIASYWTKLLTYLRMVHLISLHTKLFPMEKKQFLLVEFDSIKLSDDDSLYDCTALDYLI